MFSVHTLRMSSSTPPRRGLGANLAAFRRAKQLTLAQLSDRSGVEVGTINAIETRGSLRSKVAPRLADALGISLDLLMSDNIDPLSIDLWDPNLMRTSPYHECPVIRWEGLMNREDVPGKFQAVIPNDAMSPIVPAGATCRIEQRAPQYGDAVIVRDRLGALHFRAYRQRPSGGGFVAAPLNRAYATLDSDEHGLTVLAVFSGIDCSFATLYSQ